MNKTPRYLFEIGEGWERLTDTITGKYMEEDHLNVDDVFHFLELGNKLEIRELSEKVHLLCGDYLHAESKITEP